MGINNTFLSIFNKKDLNLKSFDDTIFNKINSDDSSFPNEKLTSLQLNLQEVLQTENSHQAFNEADGENIGSQCDSYKIKKIEMDMVSKSIKMINSGIVRHVSKDYSNVVEYFGVVDEVFDDGFSASLRRDDYDCYWQAFFKFDEILYDSDRKKVKPGAFFTLKSGQKYDTFITKDGDIKMGPHSNFYEIKFRIMKSLSEKEIIQADEESKNWIEFLNS